MPEGHRYVVSPFEIIEPSAPYCLSSQYARTALTTLLRILAAKWEPVAGDSQTYGASETCRYHRNQFCFGVELERKFDVYIESKIIIEALKQS